LNLLIIKILCIKKVGFSQQVSAVFKISPSAF